MKKETTIRLDKEFKEKLKKKGKKDESYQDVIIRFIGSKPAKTKWWEIKK